MLPPLETPDRTPPGRADVPEPGASEPARAEPPPQNRPGEGDPVYPAARPAPSHPDAPPQGSPPGASGTTGLEEPSLRSYWSARWAALPPRVRRGAALAAVLAGGLWAASALRAAFEAAPVDADAAAEAARAEWRAILRRAPAPLGARVQGALEPGDAEHADGRYEDYYALDRADSSAFALVLTSADFEPDLSVRMPGGGVRAASTLLQTPGRAEVTGLRGPGRFEVVVSSREPGAAGAYDLSVVAEILPDSLFADAPPRGDSLGLGRPSGGRFERTFALHTGADWPVAVSVVSDAFRPRVELLGPSGEVAGSYRTVERGVAGDRVRGVVVRYVPGWEAPYRLRVTSEEAGAAGRFAVDVRRVTERELRPDGRPAPGLLGDESWLAGGRYVDTYRLRVPEGTSETVLETASRTTPTALRVTRVGAPAGRAGDVRPAAETPNLAGALSARIAQPLPAGEYLVEVTSGGAVADSTRPAGGPYTLLVRHERPEPTPRPVEARPAPAARQFGASAERTGTSGGSTFGVGVTNVAVSYPGGRTRVQLSVSVRSVDYTGPWAAWESFAAKAFVVDETGRRYSPALAESVSPSGPSATPGTVRRGTVVFYAPERVADQTRFVLVASVGETSVSVPVAVP